jgi:hypothetical protein
MAWGGWYFKGGGGSCCDGDMRYSGSDGRRRRRRRREEGRKERGAGGGEREREQGPEVVLRVRIAWDTLPCGKQPMKQVFSSENRMAGVSQRVKKKTLNESKQTFQTLF